MTKNPSLKCGNAATAADQVMYLSGTSMAAPIVTGAAALMIQANPNLTPALVKAILMYTAQPMAGVNSFEQGAGRLNVEGAVLMASYVLPNAAQLTNGATMLTQPVGSYQENFIQGGEECVWGQGIITNYGFLYGSDLINKWQPMYGQGKTLADATSYSGSLLVRSTTLTSSGVLLYTGAITTTGTLLADGTLLSNGTLLADGTLLAGGTLGLRDADVREALTQLRNDAGLSRYIQYRQAVNLDSVQFTDSSEILLRKFASQGYTQGDVRWQ